jgi:hypothetical protein
MKTELSIKNSQAELSLYENGTGSLQLFGAAHLQPQSAADIQPDERYIYPRFRALSKIIVPGYWLNFTIGDVLKNSTAMLAKQTVYPNHNRDINLWLGVVAKAEWNESGEPQGIDVTLMIDKIENPKVAQGLIMNPPAIHSGSVGFNYKWQRSHPDLEYFWDKLGASIDGRMVTIDITEITGYDEFSLVYQGGDPNAKIQGFAQGLSAHTGTKPPVPDPNSITPDSQTQLSSATDGTKNPSSQSPAPNPQTALNPKEETMKISELQAQSLGFLSKPIELVSQADLDAFIGNVTAKLQELTVEKAKLTELAKLGESSLTELRKDAERHYRLVAGEGLDHDLLKLIASGPIDQVKSLGASYKLLAERMHPLIDGRRQSSMSTSEDGPKAARSDYAAYQGV